MSVTLKKRFNTLVSDVQALQKELFLSRIGQKHRSSRAIATWAALRQKVSATWDSVSAVDEITSQRENDLEMQQKAAI